MKVTSARIRNAFDQRLKSRLITGVDGKAYLDWRRLLDVVGKVLRDGVVNQGDYEEVASYTEELFDLYVKPYDIPGLPPVAEEYVDNLTRSLIRPALQVLFEQLVAAPTPRI